MEQHDVEIGTRRDLVLYRIETSKNDLKSGASAPAFTRKHFNCVSVILLCFPSMLYITCFILDV